ncbi:DNA-directed DNA polymerase [Tanacetum coccineum]
MRLKHQPKEPEESLKDEFADLHLNLPLLEFLAHVLIYDALIDKYIVSLELGKNGFEFIQSIAPEKIKDPELFIIPCRLGDSKPFDTLADLGSRVNLIPLNLFKKLNIGLLEETEDVLGLADGTKSYPVGIMKNVEMLFCGFVAMKNAAVVDVSWVAGGHVSSNLIVGLMDLVSSLGAMVSNSIDLVDMFHGLKHNVDVLVAWIMMLHVFIYNVSIFGAEVAILVDVVEEKRAWLDYSRKSHLLEDKQIPSVGVFDEVTWKTFGGNTRDLDSILEETGQEYDFTPKEGLKNKSQMVETALGKLATPSRSARDRVKKIVTAFGLYPS